MKRKFCLFGIIQVFFIVIMTLTMSMLGKDTTGLRPFNAEVETVYINLNSPPNIDTLKRTAKKEELNISIYNKERNHYYVYFSNSVNPASIFGVPSSMFVYDNFSNNNCASTDQTQQCDIILSKPDKNNDVSIFLLDKIEQTSDISNIIFYPDGTKSNDEIRNIFLNIYPEATFLAHVQPHNDIIMSIVQFFVVIDVLLFLSMIQSLYKQGKAIGIQKIFGQTISERTLIPFIVMISTMIITLGIVYFTLYHYVTFDWAYMWIVATYCVVLFVLFVVSIGYHQWSINRQAINSLMKGLIGSKALGASYICISLVLMAISATNIPLASTMARQWSNQYNHFQYYKKELDQYGVIPYKVDSLPLLVQEDSDVVAKHEQLINKLRPYIERKERTQVPYSLEGMKTFPIFQVNKNFVLNKIGDRFKMLDFEDEKKVYIFSKNKEEQATELNSMLENTVGKTDETVEVITYTNEAKEYVPDRTNLEDVKVNYIEIENPIYVVRGGDELPEDVFLAPDYGGGHYVSLETIEAQELWKQIPRFIEEIDATQYLEAPMILSKTMEQQIETSLSMFYEAATVAIICCIAVVYLIYIFLQEYFRSNRKNLVLKRIFGDSFFERYKSIFLTVSVTFMLSWLMSTLQQNEWEPVNIGGAFVTVFIMNLVIRRQIKKLERDAMNLVIKE